VTGLEQLAILAAGLGAGILTSTVGVASLLSFPVLVALGIPPVVANASNTVGLIPAGLSGSFGYRAELREHPRATVAVLVACGCGAVAGAALLLGLPSGVFEAVVPWLILFTCLLVGAQPRISAWVRRRRTGPDAHRPRHLMSPITTVFATLTGVYGGYFGAAQGVLLMAVMGIGIDETLQRLNGVKNVLAGLVNGVSGLIFAVVADVDWQVAGLIAAGSVVGAQIGATYGRRMPSAALRAFIVVVGAVALTAFLLD